MSVDAGQGMRGRRLRGSPRRAPRPRPAPLPLSQTPPHTGGRGGSAPRVGPGRALAHLTLRPQHRGLYPARACSPACRRDQLIHVGRGPRAGAGPRGSEPACRRAGAAPREAGLGSDGVRSGTKLPKRHWALLLTSPEVLPPSLRRGRSHQA